MKLTRFLSGIIFITFFCLLYVYQQNEVFRMAYLGEKKQTAFNELLDKNITLRYNIDRKASLVNIVAKAGLTDYQMPNSYRLMKFASAKERLRLKERPLKRHSLLASIFTVKRQAEAQTTTNP